WETLAKRRYATTSSSWSGWRIVSPTSCASISASPLVRIVSSTRCASIASWSSLTGRPWQALRTPEITLARLKGSLTPDRLSTDREAVSEVENRLEQFGHWRRRRIVAPSSDVRESTTRESEWRQNGQCIRSGYRQRAGSARGILRARQLDLLARGDAAGRQVVVAAHLGDELLGAHLLRCVLLGVGPEGVAALDGDGDGLLPLGAGERRRQIQGQQREGGDHQPEQEGDPGDHQPPATGGLESNARSRSGLVARGALRREGKDRGGFRTHIRTPVRSNVCATVTRCARDTQQKHRTPVWLLPCAALRWGTGQRNRE